MDVLLLFPLLLLCRRGEVVEVLTSESLLKRVSVCDFHDHERGTHQVVVGEVDNVTRLNTKILEGLGLRVNDLVQVLSLNLIG